MSQFESQFQITMNETWKENQELKSKIEQFIAPANLKEFREMMDKIGDNRAMFAIASVLKDQLER